VLASVDLQFGFLVAARGVLVPSDEDAALPVPGVAATHDGCFSSATVQMWQAAGLLLGVDGVPLPSGASEQRRRGGGVAVHGAPQLQLGCSSGSRVAPAPQLPDSGDGSSTRRRWRD
jgi:hypothetical protein